MPTASINLTPQNGNASVVAINCGTSSPKLSGTINISPYQNISSFTCINNDIQSINSLAVNPLLQTLRLENNNLSKENLETLTTSIFNNRASIVSNSNKNINFSLTGVRMGKMDRLIRLDNVNKYQAQLDKQGFNIVYAVNGETDQTWNGAGVDNNLGTAANWANNASPLTYDALYFGGTTRRNITNNLPVDTELNGITFNSGAGAFTLSGNRFVLTFDGINNNSTNTQTICANMVLSGSNRTINCTTSAITLSGVISGNSSLTKTGSAVLILGGNNTYTGDTYVNNNFVEVHNNNPFGTGSVYLSSYTGGISIPTTAVSNNVVIDNPVFIRGGRPDPGPNIVANKSTTFNGLVTFGPDSLNFSSITIDNNATLTFNGGISGLPTSPTFVRILGNTGSAKTGTLVLSSKPIIWDNTAGYFLYADRASVDIILAVAGNKFNSMILGTTLRTDVPLAINGDSVSLGFTRLGNTLLPGIINLNGNSQLINRLASFSTIFADISGNNIFNNSSTFTNLSVNNTGGNSTYTGSISGNINLTKTGSNILTLSGSTALSVGPRYTGFTAISAGTLINYALSSNPGNKVSFAQFTRTALSVTFAIPPSIGDTFTLLPGSTINTYPTVSLINATGRTGTYNSTNSRLTIS